MKKTTILILWLALVGTAWAQVSQKNVQRNASIHVFWERFRAAVIKSDKVVVASLSQFPIGMPYGVPTVRNNAQFIRRYRDVFNGETNAAKCFREALPEINPDNSAEFTVACKNAAGEEVVICSFGRTRNGWKFTGVDNINE
ncbi:MAG: hypothetical protein H0V18_20580 [Pyrinomonadaceae bacterium]|nr:hypothetical protein [Pyrinomonadaceae bacterium]